MLFTSTLILAVLAAPTLQESGLPPNRVASVAQERLQEHAELVNEYETTYLNWKREIRERRRARDDSWRELRDSPPVNDFWPRFEALAQAGEGRALEWLAEQADERYEKRSQAVAAKRELYGRLVEGYASESWLAESLAGFPRQRRWLGREALQALLEAAAAREGAHPEVAARALFMVAGELADGEPEQKLRADALYERVQRDFPETVAGVEAEALVFQMRHLRPGKPAPDFSAVDADGVQFKLSDYKGKVVLVDFWGFW